jgi:hypothetical protein
LLKFFESSSGLATQVAARDLVILATLDFGPGHRLEVGQLVGDESESSAFYIMPKGPAQSI